MDFASESTLIFSRWPIYWIISLLRLIYLQNLKFFPDVVWICYPKFPYKPWPLWWFSWNAAFKLLYSVTINKFQRKTFEKSRAVFNCRKIHCSSIPIPLHFHIQTFETSQIKKNGEEDVIAFMRFLILYFYSNWNCKTWFVFCNAKIYK